MYTAYNADTGAQIGQNYVQPDSGAGHLSGSTTDGGGLGTIVASATLPAGADGLGFQSNGMFSYSLPSYANVSVLEDLVSEGASSHLSMPSYKIAANGNFAALLGNIGDPGPAFDTFLQAAKEAYAAHPASILTMF